MFEYYNLRSCPAIDDLDHALDKLRATLTMIQACYDSTNARWEAFEAQNAPCSRWDDHDAFDAWLFSESIESIYEAYAVEEKRLADNLEWLEETIKALEKLQETLTYMDTDGLLPKC